MKNPEENIDLDALFDVLNLTGENPATAKNIMADDTVIDLLSADIGDIELDLSDLLSSDIDIPPELY